MTVMMRMMMKTIRRKELLWRNKEMKKHRWQCEGKRWGWLGEDEAGVCEEDSKNRRKKERKEGRKYFKNVS